MMRPSGETNEEVQPPSHGIAEARPVFVAGSQICFGDSCNPMARRWASSSGSWCSIHIPSSAWPGAAAATVSAAAARILERARIDHPPSGFRDRSRGDCDTSVTGATVLARCLARRRATLVSLPTVSDASWSERWDELISGGDSAAIEEFWMARLEGGVGDGSAFVDALKRMRSAGKKTVAATLLELAADQALADGAWEARKRFLVELIRLGLGDGEKWRAGLVECVRRLWAGSPSLEKLLKDFALPPARKPLETLETIETWLAYDVGGVFAMAGRGPGGSSKSTRSSGCSASTSRGRSASRCPSTRREST